MARKILAGAVLAMLCLVIGLTVDFGDEADATVKYTPTRGNLPFAECYTDTTNATGYDSIRVQCDVVTTWWISCTTANIEYWFKSAGYDTATTVDGAKAISTAGIEQEWHVPPTWIKIRAVSGSPIYTVRIEGVELAWDAGTGIHDITNAIE